MKKISIFGLTTCITLLGCTIGSDGKDGSICSVIQNNDGSATIKCSDGTSATVENGDAGSDGNSCTVIKNDDGTGKVVCTDGSSYLISSTNMPTTEGYDYCLPGYFGPDCLPCTCKNGTCNDTPQGDGHCLCEFNYSGINCDICAENYSGANCIFYNYGSFTASDGNTYKTFTINNQTWMAENLRNADIEHYSVDDNSANDAKYGYLYTWENAMKACPSGWRLPTNEEFEKLVSTIDLTSIRDSSWENGSNISGFSALPTGGLYSDGSSLRFLGFGYEAFFWSSTPASYGAYYLHVANSIFARVYNDDVLNAFSVRCLKDSN